MNDGIRVVIERRGGGRWYWKMTAFGTEYRGKRSECSPVKAGEQAEAQIAQIEAAKEKATELLPDGR